jgi:hypothetical protein
MLIHLITLSVGLIIAFGLQQIVESLRRRNRIRKARKLDLESQHDSADPPTETSSLD